MHRYYIHIFLTLAGMALFNKSGAQAPVVQQVIGAGGGSKTIGTYTIDFTVGEAVIATAGTDPSCTEGFHQPLTARDLPDSNLINASWYMKVYPNPVHGQLTIHTYMDRSGDLDLRLIDIMGRVLLVSHFSFLQGYNDATINMSWLARGIYVLSVVDHVHGGHTEFKLLKE